MLAVAGEQLGERRCGVAGAQVEGLGAGSSKTRRPRARSRSPITTRSGCSASGWSCSSRTVSSGSSTATVLVPTSITSHSARSRWVSRRAARRADPAAGAVGGGAAAVEGGGELPGHERAAVLDARRSRPGSESRASSARSPDSTSTPAARSGRGAAGGDRVGVGLGEDHAAYAGGDQRLGAGAGAAGVVARLEGDDRGGAAGPRRRPGRARRPRRAGCRRRGGGPRRPVRRRRRAGRSRPAGSGRAARRGSRRARGRAASRPARLALMRHRCRPSGPVTRGLRGDGSRCARRRRARRSPACASHPDFHRRSRSSTWSTGHWL